MKKTIPMIPMILCIIVCLAVCFVVMRMRTGMSVMPHQSEGVDLVVVNNSSDKISTAFTKDGSTASRVVRPGEKATGGKGLLRIFVAKRNGNYEIQYPYPRPAGKPVEISLTQVLNAVHNPELEKELYVEKGRIDDIRVDYEDIRQME
jgi:hypothetical protein